MTTWVWVNLGTGTGLLSEGTNIKVLWHSYEGIMIKKSEYDNQENQIENYIFKITSRSSRDQRVNSLYSSNAIIAPFVLVNIGSGHVLLPDGTEHLLRHVWWKYSKVQIPVCRNIPNKKGSRHKPFPKFSDCRFYR